MLRVEGRIANEDAEFDGAIEIDQETGLIASVGPRGGLSELDTEGCIIFAGFAAAAKAPNGATRCRR